MSTMRRFSGSVSTLVGYLDLPEAGLRFLVGVDVGVQLTRQPCG